MVTFFPVERSERAKNPILPLWNFLMGSRAQTFSTSYIILVPRTPPDTTQGAKNGQNATLKSNDDS